MSESCAQCGCELFDAERFCPECGSATGVAVGVVTPPGPVTPGRAPVVSPRTQLGRPTQPCSQCSYQLADVERFCPKCGTPRPGVAPRVRARKVWDEVLDRLRAATVGRYEVERELGRGGMAGVFLAHEKSLHRKVAIKVLRPDLTSDEAMVARFLREARTMANFQHPNILTVYTVESTNDLHWFAMQYVTGRSLDRILDETGPLPVAAMQWVTYQSARGLAYAHQAGVIHRDIKPGNIMIDARGNALVTDFGIAKVTDTSLTATTTQMGTPLYMSPEQCHGVQLTPSSDQYALGNVAYEMLAGHPPFQAPTPVALAIAITTKEPPPLRPDRADCPPEVEAAILQMLGKKPADRFESVLQAATALGGDHVSEDDPVREYLGALARAEAPVHDTRVLTPRTPLPGVSSRPRVTPLATAAVAPSPRRAQLAIAGVVVAAALVTWVLRRGESPAAAPAPVPPPVAVMPDTFGGLPDAASTPPAATPPSSPGATPVPPPATPGPRRPVGGATSVASEPPGATVADAAPVPAPSPARDTAVVREERPAAPAAPPPKPVDHTADVRQALERYEAAINSRSMSQLRVAYPGLRDDQEAQWRDLFGKDIEELKGDLTIRGIKDLGVDAEATFVLALTFKPKRDVAQTVRIAGTATLKPVDGVWRIISLATRAE